MNEIVQEQQAGELVKTLVDQAGAIVVKDHATYELAAGVLVSVKNGIKEVKKYWDDPIKKQQAALDSLKDKRNSMLDPLIQAEVGLKIAINDFRIKDDLERKAREEIARKAVEAKAREEQQALAKEMEAFGNAEVAAKIASAPVVVPPVVVQSAPKVAGVSFRDDWRAEVIDPQLIPREYLIPDEKKLSALAKAMKADAKVAGVRFWCEKIVVAGR